MTAFDDRSTTRARPAGPWWERAACRGKDLDMFFPTRANSRDAQLARLICQSCTAQQECLASAVAARMTSGIWGGRFFDEGRDRHIPHTSTATSRAELAFQRRSDALERFEYLVDEGLREATAYKAIAAEYGVIANCARDWIRMARADAKAAQDP